MQGTMAQYSPDDMYTNAKARPEEAELVYPYSVVRVFRLVDDTPLGTLKIAKKNEDNQYLPNTSFKVSYNSDMSDSLGTYKTGSDGTVTISDLNAQSRVHCYFF